MLIVQGDAFAEIPIKQKGEINVQKSFKKRQVWTRLPGPAAGSVNAFWLQ
jgi:hypothetical protein